MPDLSLSVIELPDTGDARGSSFGIPAELLKDPFPVADIHVAAIEPGAVRGNHYHAVRREILIVMADDRWSLHWDDGDGTEVRRRDFTGPGTVAITIPLGASHAIRNDGSATLRMMGLTDGPYDPERPDAYRRMVV